MIFSLEQLQDGKWVNVSYGFFADAHDALEEMDWASETFGVSKDELRIRTIKKIPEEDVSRCPCGGMVRWTVNGDCWCADCGETYPIGDERLK